ncbi:MAG: NAD(P)H-hydrate dehydratase [Candidatus Omnitrophota bacterium]|nr:MAG: NAD(P)H-hydrate dehydratase [Candidatus Omnitrophota bacterium]
MCEFNTEFLIRKDDAYKGDFGHIFVLAGAKGFTGAAFLCSQAALLSGAGLVTLGIPESLNCILAVKLTEAMTLPLPETEQGTLDFTAFKKIKEFINKFDVLAIGPGLSQNLSTQMLVRKIVGDIDKPMVIDADGLNALCGHLHLLKANKSVKIITPHLGEMARLLHREKILKKERSTLAKTFASMYNVITVLKGAQTVVSAADGRVFINTTGNPGMAKGGTGDVLTGIVAALLAQQTHQAFNAAKAAVYAHGLSGDIALQNVAQISLLASDILSNLPIAFKQMENAGVAQWKRS